MVSVLELLAFSWGIAGCVWALDWGALGLGIGAGVVGARGVWAWVLTSPGMSSPVTRCSTASVAGAEAAGPT